MDSYSTILPYYQYLSSALLKLLKAGFNRRLFWEVWEAQMAGFGLLRELASREPAGRWLYGLI